MLERVKVSHSFVISRYSHNDIGIVYKHRNDLEFDQTHPNVLMQDFGGFLVLVRLVEAENLDLVKLLASTNLTETNSSLLK